MTEQNASSVLSDDSEITFPESSSTTSSSSFESTLSTTLVTIDNNHPWNSTPLDAFTVSEGLLLIIACTCIITLFIKIFDL